MAPILRQLRAGLEQLYGDRLRDVVLFGSQARGDAGEGSDIDVMVVLAGDVDAGSEIARTSELRSSLSLEHEVVVSCMYMPETEYCAEQSPLSRNVRREGIAA